MEFFSVELVKETTSPLNGAICREYKISVKDGSKMVFSLGGGEFVSRREVFFSTITPAES